MSAAQEQLWFLEQMSVRSSLYILGSAFRLTGSLDEAALAAALRQIVRRHGVLRSRYDDVDGRPRQTIDRAARLDLAWHDVRDHPDRETRAEQIVGSLLSSPFDLAAGPPFRAAVVRVEDQHHIAAFAFHHIVAGDDSMPVFFHELEHLYRAYRGLAGSAADPLPPLPVQYADYAAWQRTWLDGDAARDELAACTRTLAGAPPLLELPLDRARPRRQSFTADVVRQPVGREVLRALQTLARDESVTLFTVLLTGALALLARVSGQDDVVIGTPVAGRAPEELHGLIGCFRNILPLRGDLADDPTVRELLRRVRSTVIEGLVHQDIPFEHIVRELQPHRDLSYSQVVQVVFAASTDGPSGGRFADLVLDAYDVPIRSTVYDLVVRASVDSESLVLDLVYATDLFLRGSVERLAEGLVSVLRGLAGGVGRPASELVVISDEQRVLLVREWNAAASERVTGSVHGLVEAQVRRSPDAVAVVSAGSGSVTYAEVDRRAGRLAGVLRGCGVGPDMVVGVCARRSVDLVVALLAVLKAGGAYLPLDSSYPADRLGFMVADAGAELVLAHRGEWEPDGRARVLWLEELSLDEPGLPTASVPVAPENLAYVIYTSGSTGNPKGVAIRHGGVTNNVADLNGRFSVGVGDRIAALSALSFDMAVYELLGVLGSGATVVLPEPGRSDEPAHWAELVHGHGVTIWHSVPQRTRALLDECGDRAPTLLRPLRLVLSGGDRLPAEVVAMLWRATSGRTTVVNMGGATEASIHSTLVELAAADLERVRLPYGRPMKGQALYVVDGRLEPVPVGVVGELLIGGYGLARGYVGQPDRTADRFLPDPFGPPGGRVYRTGDLARWRDDGTVELLSRADHQVKVRGFRIELGEIEAALRAVTGVTEAVASTATDTVGEQRLVAYVVPDAGHDLTPGALRARLRHRLPQYMVPTTVHFLDRLPLTANGKIDRRALAAVPAAPPVAAAVAAGTPVEVVLSALWAILLGRSTISPTDDFFELGGHSLLAMRLAARIRDIFGVAISLHAIFEHRTVADLAHHLTSTHTAAHDTAQVLLEEAGQ